MANTRTTRIRSIMLAVVAAAVVFTSCSAETPPAPDPDTVAACAAARADQAELDQLAKDIQLNEIGQQAARGNGPSYAATVDRLVRERAALDQKVLVAESHLRTHSLACTSVK